MSDLLTKFLVHFDPLYHGRTVAGIANGLILTNGFAFPRIDGGYNLYRGTARGAIDTIVGVAQQWSLSIEPFPWVVQAPDQTYFYELVPIGPGGVEAIANPSDPQIVKVRTDDAGDVPVPVPPAPRGLMVTPAAGGAFDLRWEYQASSHFAAASVFRIVNDNGTGTMDYDTVVASVNLRGSLSGSGDYGWTSGAFSHGTAVKWAVRAETAGAARELNTREVSATADAEGPADHRIAAAAWGTDE